MRGRGETGNDIRQQIAEGRARLDLGVPFLGLGMTVPVDVAEIIRDREMRRRRQVGERHRLAGKPVALFGEPVNIVKMDMQVGHRRAHDFRRRVATHRDTLDVTLVQQGRTDLADEFFLEPDCQPPDFGAFSRGSPDQARRLVLGFFEIFGNHHGAGQHHAVLGHKHRHVTGRIQRQEFLMPFPG